MPRALGRVGATVLAALLAACAQTHGRREPDAGRPALDAGERTPTPTPEAADPPGPANFNPVRVLGRAPAGATVRVHDGASCAGVALGEGVADAGGTFRVIAPVPDDVVVVFHATAQRPGEGVSVCSTAGVRYEEDSTPPDPPVLEGTIPASPAPEPGPQVFGRAEPGSLVRLFLDPGCTDLRSASEADDTGRFLLAVGLPPEQVSAIHATATDRAGNESGCSEPLLYEALPE